MIASDPISPKRESSVSLRARAPRSKDEDPTVSKTPLLDRIRTSADLRAHPETDLRQIADDLGEVLWICPNPYRRGDPDVPVQVPAARGPMQHVHDLRHHGVQGLCRKRARPHARPGPDQFTFDMPPHAFGDGFDLVGNPVLPTRPKIGGIRRKNGQWRL